MLCHINYNADKQLLREYFFSNYDRARHHKTAASEIPYWLKLFGCDDIVNPVLEDLGLTGLYCLPRFSYQLRDTQLPRHIDIDRIIGININLMDDHIPTIHMDGTAYEYQCALLDVGAVIHSVEPAPYDRLVLKFAFREPWEKIYGILRDRNLVEEYKYQSVLTDENKKFVRL